MKIDRRDFLNEWILDNGSYKLVALFITLILWVSVLGRKETTVTREVPLIISVSQDRIVTSTSARNVRFELSGSRRALRKFSAERIEPITVDLSNGQLGRLVVTVPEEMLKLPFGVKVLSVSPPTIVVDIEETQKKSVPVVVVWRDQTEKNEVILKTEVDPKEITIEGTRAGLQKVREILTHEISSVEAKDEDGQKVIRTKTRTLEGEGLRSLPEQEVTVRF